jgi:hypothetical protein
MVATVPPPQTISEGRQFELPMRSALAVAAERLEKALADLEAAHRAFEAAPGSDAAARHELAEKHQALRAHAAERLWFLLVQREALGLTHHENVLAFYRGPPALRRVAGPRLRPR